MKLVPEIYVSATWRTEAPREYAEQKGTYDIGMKLKLRIQVEKLRIMNQRRNAYLRQDVRLWDDDQRNLETKKTGIDSSREGTDN